jgi:iron complex transport system substrate-binding protein
MPLYTVDLARLADLDPDLIVTQTHCDVCAVTPRELSRDGQTHCDHPVVAFGASTLDGVLDDFLRVARALGVTGAGETLVQRIRARLETARARTAARPHPTVVCLEWIDPIFPMSNWAPEIVAIAGGRCLLGIPGQHSSTTPWDAVRAADPDVLVVAPCGFDLRRTLDEMPTLAQKPGFADLRAARGGRVYAADGNLYFNRSGPSLFETPELLAEMLHPDAFAPAHEGAAWVRWSAGAGASAGA